MKLDQVIDDTFIGKKVKVYSDDHFNSCIGTIINVNLSSKYQFMIAINRNDNEIKAGFKAYELELI